MNEFRSKAINISPLRGFFRRTRQKEKCLKHALSDLSLNFHGSFSLFASLPGTSPANLRGARRSSMQSSVDREANPSGLEFPEL
ncbi:MAG TPA: hypothetical protein DHU55_01270 [Blastocatellia bacterium]|jgi:hypothetical protein|nr:hypothetical protein [Blastocatellia bacterium]HCX28394.1 hypothetical protein [Blastocatellia bacterium]